MLSDEERSSALMGVAAQVVDKHVNLSTQFSTSESTECNAGDTVYAYACVALRLGLLYMMFKDAIKEGDGNRVLLVWKFLFLIFKASKRRNYAIEAFTLLAQYYLILPPRLAEQLKWSRFVNVHGLPGHNISCDLHMEHLNRLAKTAVDGLGANKTEKAIFRVGKTVGSLFRTTENFDKQNNVTPPSGSHSEKSNAKDLNKIISIQHQQQVFQQKDGRKHKSFTKLKNNLIRSIKEDELKDWMIEHYANMVVK